MNPTTGLEPALEKEWLKRWEQNVLHDIGRSRPCETPYDPTLQKIFETNFDPGSWEGVWTAEWIVHFRRVASAGK